MKACQQKLAAQYGRTVYTPKKRIKAAHACPPPPTTNYSATFLSFLLAEYFCLSAYLWKSIRTRARRTLFHTGFEQGHRTPDSGKCKKLGFKPTSPRDNGNNM